ncbi:MAG: NfeD family protein [Desulfobulbales bacterium]|nr:NfeD family protein [Desulfobulbales bacterium]
MAFSPSLIWFLAGVVFLVLELLVPGFILIFFTAGSWITAIAALFVDIDLTAQISIFIISSLASLFTLRKYSLETFKGKTRENIDDNYTESKIGKTAVVTKSISPHVPGEIKVLGSYWRATSETEIAAGKSVIIASQESEDGLTFKVKPL